MLVLAAVAVAASAAGPSLGAAGAAGAAGPSHGAAWAEEAARDDPSKALLALPQG